MEENPYQSLSRVFHEPSRLAIVSSLASVRDGLSFSDLQETTELTAGNLSRHLRMLEEADAVTINKSFVGLRPRTTVELTDAGRQEFIAYLQTLEQVLQRAGEALDGADATADSITSLQSLPA